MARQPLWTVREDPSGAGPLVVTPPNPGTAGRAMAGFGSALFQVGSLLTAEAKDAEQRTRALQQQTAVDDYTLEATQKFLTIRQEITAMPDPDQAAARWAQARTELLPTGAAEGDETDETFQLKRQRYDREMASWEKVIAADIQARRVQQAQDSLTAARAASIAMRDTSLFLERLQDAAPLVGWTQQQVQDEFAAVDRAVSQELAKDRVAAKVARMPYDEAVAYLNSDAPFYGTGLNPQAKQEFLDKQMGLLSRQRAKAIQEANLAESVRQHNAAQYLGRAGQGQPVDVDAMWKLVEAGQLDAGAARTVQEMIVKGPATENDPATYARLLELQDEVSRGSKAPQDLAAFALANAGTKLTASAWQGALAHAANVYSPQMQAINEEVQQAGRQLVTVTDQSLEALQMLADPALLQNAENQRANQYRQVDYVRRSLMDYVRDNPKATPDDIYVQRLRLLRNLQRQHADEVKSLLEAYEAGKLNPPAPPAGVSPTAAQAKGIQEAGVDLLTGGLRLDLNPQHPPAGLESVWPALDEPRRAQVLRLLAKGATVEDILAAIRRGP